MSKRKTIMIIDDSVDILTVVERILATDFDVITLSDEQHILDSVRDALPDLLILDILMQTTDGYQLIRELQADIELSRIPIIFFTGKTAPDDVRRGLQLGAYDYIKKPIEIIEFRSRINSVLTIKEREEKLFQKSTIDSLTGVLNREAILQSLNIEFARWHRRREPFSIAMLDIDHFKNFNDRFGHQVGDAVLIEFCQFIQSHIRKSDILGRYGGEEFIIIFGDTSVGDALVVLQKILDEMNRTKFIKGIHTIHFSAGVADATQVKTGNTMGGVAELIGLADERLYAAKKAGRNQISHC